MERKITLKAKKQDMERCFTCLICNKLYVRATSINECLHTFCRKCIEDKLIEENLKACPICNADLGVAPLDRLRTDNTWEDLRLNVFKPKPNSVKAETETVAASLQYSRKKKKSVSSLLATPSREPASPESDPDAPLEPEKIGEETEAVPVPLIQSLSRPASKFRKRPRKNPRPKKSETRLEPEQPHKESDNGFLNIEQDNGLARASTSKEYNSEKVNKEIPILSDVLSKPLSTAMEVTPIKSNGIGKANQDNVSSCGGDKEEVSGVKSEECAEENQNTVLNHSEGNNTVTGIANQNSVLVSSDCHTEEVSGEKPENNNGEDQNQENVSTSGKISGEKGKAKAYSPPVLRPRRQRKMNSDGTSRNAIPMELENRAGASNSPVWFSLVAAGNQNTDRPLPQISPLYLRVTNGNLPVSYVKKYLVKKLNLESEDEVDIWLRQEPVCSTQRLHNLVDWWIQTTPISERRSAMVGSSGAEFVMVLYYSRSHLFC
ncbi:hypothetical protein EUTSA_v10022423mg [Eutrema salsugineum]|uniref:RING-type domain-containing protein n=1 Tax=Eutrema salsugineum TaxID=72664 RepID=V4LYG3_EUTSA|nr:hypothetical protein EUTSA_v10022423mg [Eutrema salsugineum]